VAAPYAFTAPSPWGALAAFNANWIHAYAP
jgi:hypothetical protein